MKKYMTILIIIVAIILILAGGFLYKKILYHRYGLLGFKDYVIPSYKISQIKTFSEIPGFIFEYPVFKGFEITKENKISDNEYHIGMDIGGVKNPKIIIEKQEYGKNDFEIPAQAVSFPNPNKVPYVYTKENSLHEIKNYGYIAFYGKDYKYWVSLDGILNEDGFPVDKFFNKIIETFKFITCSPENIGAEKLSELAKVTMSMNYIQAQQVAGAEKVIEKLKQDNENQDDFYATVKVGERSGNVGHLITFNLMHKNNFLPENCNKVGNPSGKDRVMVYDSNSQKIIEDLLTQ